MQIQWVVVKLLPLMIALFRVTGSAKEWPWRWSVVTDCIEIDAFARCPLVSVR
jgi:hypothetical protein